MAFESQIGERRRNARIAICLGVGEGLAIGSEGIGGAMSKPPKIWRTTWDHSVTYATPLEWIDGFLEERRSEFVQATQNHEYGIPLPTDLAPKVAKCWRDRDPKSLKDVLRIQRILAVSSKTRELFEGFNIGDASFSPIKLLKRNGVDEFEGEWFIFNPTQSRETTNLELSEGGVLSDGLFYFKPLTARVVVDPDRVDGADIWFDSRVCTGGIYFSDRLRKACKSYIRGLSFEKVEVQ